MFLKMFKDECNVQHFKFVHDVPEEFTTCYWQKTAGVKKYWLAYRIILCIYFILTFIFIVVYQDEMEGYQKFLIYLTNWTYLAQMITFILALVIVVERWKLEKRQKDTPLMGMTRLPVLYRIFWISYTGVAGGSMVVAVIFWLFIYSPENFKNPAVTLITHLSNFVIMVVDFILVSFPMRFLHFYVPLLYMLIYGIFTLIYQFSGGTGMKGQIPVYLILDWRNPAKATVTCLIVVTVASLSHCSFCLIQALKQYLRTFSAVSYNKPDGTPRTGSAQLEAGQGPKPPEPKNKREKKVDQNADNSADKNAEKITETKASKKKEEKERKKEKIEENEEKKEEKKERKKEKIEEKEEKKEEKKERKKEKKEEKEEKKEEKKGEKKEGKKEEKKGEKKEGKKEKKKEENKVHKEPEGGGSGNVQDV